MAQNRGLKLNVPSPGSVNSASCGPGPGPVDHKGPVDHRTCGRLAKAARPQDLLSARRSRDPTKRYRSGGDDHIMNLSVRLSVPLNRYK